MFIGRCFSLEKPVGAAVCSAQPARCRAPVPRRSPLFWRSKGSMEAVVELVSGEKTMMKRGREGLKNHLDLEINSVFSVSRKKMFFLYCRDV